MMRSSNAISLLLVLAVFFPSWIQYGLANVVPETPSPSPSQSPSSVVAESPHHHQLPSIYHQSPQMTPSISPSYAEAPSPQMPGIHHHQPPQMTPSISPSYAEAPSPQMPDIHYHESPSVSPSQSPKLSPHDYNEPPSPSPSLPPLFRPSSPTPSPVSPPPQYHHRHHGPHFKPPPSSKPSNCWSYVMEVNDCSNQITMAYYGYNRNIKPSCCQAINRTSRECLFDRLFFRTKSTYFVLWLQEHCARIAQS